ncbi:histidine phosphatase family protein [Dehalobacter sp. DCM]|uniref:histidine phosphatase family protein n=1 Tax=Dehalobacter sp. DCM TaxID=2907827 RepID=UPI0030818EEF|nr:histidine phosphatase family protein [Dehalobacter sp. DCM]
MDNNHLYHLYLIRHAKTEGNIARRYIGRTNEPLCAQGIAELQAKIDAKVYPLVEYVFSSPMIRCDQTRGLIYPDAPFSIVEAFAEYNFGFFENKAYDELKDTPEYQCWLDSEGKGKIPGGESADEFKARCLDGFTKVMATIETAGIRHIALIIHGGTIMALLEAYSPESVDFYHWQVKNGEGYHLIIDPLSWNKTHKAQSVTKLGINEKSAVNTHEI